MRPALGAVIVILVALGAGMFRYQSAELQRLQLQLKALSQSAQGKEEVREIRTILRERTIVAESPVVGELMASSPTVNHAPKLSAEEKAHRDSLIAAAQTNVISEAYERERSDPSWSEGATDMLTKSFSSEDSDGWTTRVECRQTMCKVEFGWDDDTVGQAGNPVRRTRPWPGRGFSNVDLETKSGSMYVAREGFDLPQADLAQLDF